MSLSGKLYNNKALSLSGAKWAYPAFEWAYSAGLWAYPAEIVSLSGANWAYPAVIWAYPADELIRRKMLILHVFCRCFEWAYPAKSQKNKGSCWIERMSREISALSSNQKMEAFSVLSNNCLIKLWRLIWIWKHIGELVSPKSLLPRGGGPRPRRPDGAGKRARWPKYMHVLWP